LLLPDLEVVKEWDGWPAGSRSFALDATFQRYARRDKDGNVSVRRLDSDEELYPLPGLGPCQDYWGLEFSPAGRRLYQGCEAKEGPRGRRWKLEGAEPFLLLDVAHPAFAFRPDGRQCAVGDPDGSIWIWDLEKNREVRRLKAVQEAGWVRWNPKRSQLLLATPSGWRVVDVNSGKVASKNPQQVAFQHAKWHPEGRLLAVSSRHPDLKIYLWDTQTGQLVLPPLEGHRQDGVIVRFNQAGDR
jgi:WD40 repeat protein